ncbi:hypothetical protein ACHAXS_003000, partial [Conticribra weissflogii]
NQEVYQDCTENTGAVLVIEILEHQSDVADDEACCFFFRDLADANGCGFSPSGEIRSEVHESQVVKLLRNSGQNHVDDVTMNDDESTQSKTQQLFPGILLQSENLGSQSNINSEQSEPIACCIMRGSQKVAQGKDTDASGRARGVEAKWIDVELCALRLKSVDVDLLITLSVPQNGNEDGDTEKCQKRSNYSNVFRNVLESLDIRDWSLFDG